MGTGPAVTLSYYISNLARIGSYAPSQGVYICTQTSGSSLPAVPLIQIQTEVKSPLLPSPRDRQNQNMGLWKQGSEMGSVGEEEICKRAELGLTCKCTKANVAVFNWCHTVVLTDSQ